MYMHIQIFSIVRCYIFYKRSRFTEISVKMHVKITNWANLASNLFNFLLYYSHFTEKKYRKKDIDMVFAKLITLITSILVILCLWNARNWSCQSGINRFFQCVPPGFVLDFTMHSFVLSKKKKPIIVLTILLQR